MASAAGRQLTESHRQAQARLGLLTVNQMRAIWPLLDPEDLDGTFQRWLAAALPLIQGQRSMSARLAASYLAAFKTVEAGVGAAGFIPVLSDRADVPAVTTSLLVTGPLSIKRAMTRSVPLGRAVATAERSSAAAGMRHAIDGGRETITRTVRADRDASGWTRVASGKACKFCGDLDGKFHRDDTADFPAHDGCTCTQEPTYRGSRTAAPAERRLNAGDLTLSQGQQIAASGERVGRGEITLAEHRRFVRELTGTDSRGRRR